MFRHSLSRRDAFLVLLGASSMHLWAVMFGTVSPGSVDDLSNGTHLSQVTNFNNILPLAKIVTQTATATTTATATRTATVTKTSLQTQFVESSESWNYEALDILAGQKNEPQEVLPPSTLVSHAPGWTLFRNLYMTNDTLYIVTDDAVSTPSRAGPENSRDRKPDYYGPHGEDMTYGFTKAEGWPEIRQMTSTGLSAENTRENIALREPLPQNMQFISVKEAKRRWGEVTIKDDHGVERQKSRVWVVKGNSLLFNDPSQFLRHYYHFVAELFFGVQAFWNSAFSPAPKSDALAFHYSTSHASEPPPVHRAIFIHSNADGWRDGPGFNRYFLRAAFPSLTIEHEEDWQDRVKASMEGVADGSSRERVWRFPVALLTDRSASHRGPICGSQTQRTAAEAWDYMRKTGKLKGIHVGGWWAPVREALWKFAGAEVEAGVVNGQQVALSIGQTNPANDEATPKREPVDVNDESQAALPMPSEVVITYISRQSARRRKLVEEDHELMVESLIGLVNRKNEERKALVDKRKNDVLKAKNMKMVSSKGPDAVLPPSWVFEVLEAEHLTKDQQVQAAARTTILLGVHGNGLSHLVWMKPTRLSSVIEIFCPPGFAHDYWWTARSLGMRHWAMWNDTGRTWPDKPQVDYPECFQENEIPVFGPAVAQLIEDRVNGKL